MLGLKFHKSRTFSVAFEVVYHGRETHIQVIDNLNLIAQSPWG